MKNISLLPAEYKIHKSSAKKINGFAVAMAFLILGFVLIYAVLSFAQPSQRAELEEIKRQRQDIRRKIAEYKPYEDMLKKIEASSRLVGEAMGTGPEWDVLVKEISDSIPYGIRLSDFSASYSGKSGELSVRGWGESYSHVAAWLSSLKKIKDLSDVRCRFAAKSGSDGGGENVQFEITASLAQGKPYVLPLERGMGQ